MHATSHTPDRQTVSKVVILDFVIGLLSLKKIKYGILRDFILVLRHTAVGKHLGATLRKEKQTELDNSIIGIGIALGTSFFILYTRKKNWMNPKIIWLICFGLLAVGIFGLLISKPQIRNDRIMYFGFCVPIIYWIFDRISKRISEIVHKRDFILFMRHSDEINDGLGAKNPHVKKSDKLFSFGLLIIIVVTLLIGIKVI